MSEPIAIGNKKSDRGPFPDLSNLLTGWFHQDFDIEGPDLATIIPKFVAASRRAGAQGTVEDIQRFIGIYGKDDATLRDAVERILKPEVILEGWEGMTTREWLLRVAELVEAALQSKPVTE